MYVSNMNDNSYRLLEYLYSAGLNTETTITNELHNYFMQVDSLDLLSHDDKVLSMLNKLSDQKLIVYHKISVNQSIDNQIAWTAHITTDGVKFYLEWRQQVKNLNRQTTNRQTTNVFKSIIDTKYFWECLITIVVTLICAALAKIFGFV